MKGVLVPEEGLFEFSLGTGSGLSLGFDLLPKQQVLTCVPHCASVSILSHVQECLCISYTNIRNILCNIFPDASAAENV